MRTQVFDVIKLRYQWDERYLASPAANQWKCFDLHWDREQYDITADDATVNPVDDLSEFNLYTSKIKLDEHQDCIINQLASSVTYVPVDPPEDPDVEPGPPTMANFKVHFYRRLQTTSGVQDAQIAVGDIVDIGYSYYANKVATQFDQKAYYNYILDEAEYNFVSLDILSSATKIAAGFGTVNILNSLLLS